MDFINKTIIKIIPFLPKSVIRLFSKKYVAGTTNKEVIKTIKNLNFQQQSVTVDILGEHTNVLHECDNITNKYIELLYHIDKNNLNCNLSIKPSHIGADISYSTALHNFKKILKTASELENFIRIDMENSQLTDMTLKLYKDLKNISQNIGIVIQAYLHRSKKDILNLDKGANIRICKGIYNESSNIAYKDYNDINNNFLDLLRSAFENNIYVGIATHDKNLLTKCFKLIKDMNVNTDNFEFQYLHGVPMDDIIKIYKVKKYKIRAYVPFGDNWYEYSIRRIKENPKIASYIIKNIFLK